MIKPTSGNLLQANSEALVNTVNTEGVMGKGIALQFKQAYPEVFKDYADACKRGEVRLGKMHVVDTGGLVGGPRWIINFPTKGHWRAKSRLLDIKSGLADLVRVVRSLGIKSIALPPLGCGHGGLEWRAVRPLIEVAFSELPDVEVLMFAPDGAPAPEAMVNRSERPAMTVGRASLLALIERYMDGLLDPFVSLLEVHKLMYFLQDTGQPLRLKYSQGAYGPYAENLRQVLIKMEGHFLSGYGDGNDTPTKPLEILGGAAEEAARFLASYPEVRERIERVSELINGYEDAYGLELLSSVHWAIRSDERAATSPEAAIEFVHQWNPRKRKLLKSDHLREAWLRIQKVGAKRGELFN